jgi:hypothetical protein
LRRQSVFERSGYRFASRKRVKTTDQGLASDFDQKRGSDNGGLVPQIREAMRAEVERLVEEIKQSVGLLRRHL